MSGQHPLFYRWGKVYEPLLSLKYNGSRVSYTFPHLQTKGCWPEIVVLHKRLSLSSKPRVRVIFWIIWCVLLPQYSILHDVFTWKNSRRSNNCGTHCIKHQKWDLFLQMLMNIRWKNVLLYYILTTWHSAVAIQRLRAAEHASRNSSEWLSDTTCFVAVLYIHVALFYR